jgi:agmatinase
MNQPQARLNLPFVGIPSFMRSPIVEDLDKLDADIAILGVPSDEGSPWYPGARMAPRQMREMSLRYAGYGPMQESAGYYDIQEDRRYLEYETRNHRIVDCGDVDIIYTNPERTFDNLTNSVKKILSKGALPVVLGGDHAVAYGVVRAYEEPITVIHFDAHLDYRPFEHGNIWGNGSPMRRISGLDHVGKIIQIGMRGIRASKDDLNLALTGGNDIMTVKEFRRRGIEKALEQLPAGGKVYVTMDIDVLDMPLVPGCASAETGGLSYEELRDALAQIAIQAEVVGFDILEINPLLDVPSNVTSLIGSQLAIEFMARIVDNPLYLKRKGRLPGMEKAREDLFSV